MFRIAEREVLPRARGRELLPRWSLRTVRSFPTRPLHVRCHASGKIATKVTAVAA